MTIDELTTILAATNLPYTYYQYPSNAAPLLPYLVYFFPNMTPVTADNNVYAPIYDVIVELYTAEKDFNTEEALEAVFFANNIVYNKSENYINAEHMYQIVYELGEIIEYGTN